MLNLYLHSKFDYVKTIIKKLCISKNKYGLPCDCLVVNHHPPPPPPPPPHHHHHYFLTERESISDDITSSFHYTLYRILASTVIFDTLNQHLSFYTKTDFDECKDQDLNKCHEKAKCTNTEGSYNCTCIDGYVGDGFLCQGNGCIFVVFFITNYMMVN